ncbi:MAG TPA: GNAT family N-acetyltransferase [Caulobacteraceae bacterium]|nr:GNAT family N-acetyltransferase [Caulobacteraceae bacterium]
MRVRRATRADAAALGEVHAAAFDPPWTADEILRFAEDPGGFALAAEAEGALAGFVLCRVVAGEAEVLTLAVRPADRRKGAASALLAEAGALASLRAQSLFLEVAADNEGAIALYRQTGFRTVGRRAGYYARPGGPAVDALVMRRALNT